MTVPPTSTIIMLSPRAADSNACTGTALPINLCHREYHLPALEINAIVAHSSRAPAVRTNKSPSARSRQANSNIDHQRAIATIPIVSNLPRLRSIRLL
jgi:hypothetical protein